MSLVKACDYFYTSVIFLLYQLIEVSFASVYHINLLLKFLRISTFLSVNGLFINLLPVFLQCKVEEYS